MVDPPDMSEDADPAFHSGSYRTIAPHFAKLTGRP
jgi:hypothetical protein